MARRPIRRKSNSPPRRAEPAACRKRELARSFPLSLPAISRRREVPVPFFDWLLSRKCCERGLLNESPRRGTDALRGGFCCPLDCLRPRRLSPCTGARRTVVRLRRRRNLSAAAALGAAGV